MSAAVRASAPPVLAGATGLLLAALAGCGPGHPPAIRDTDRGGPALALTPGWSGARVTGPGPVLFVTQVPVAPAGDEGRAGGFGVATGTFGSQAGQVDAAPRGGDLLIRYPDGEVRNLTAEAGYGSLGAAQDEDAIAVRQPCVHWDGERALFSMVIGAPVNLEQVEEFHWQIYEVSGLGKGETVNIRRLDGQPEGFDNVSPVYGSEDQVYFTSSMPRSGEPAMVQLDEYDATVAVTGIYRLDPDGGLTLVEHAPSGVFGLVVDAFGRVLFTKWDHLQRDQQGDEPFTAAVYGPVTYADESADAASTTAIEGAEVYPEARSGRDPGFDPTRNTHTFNQFFPWEMNEDGSGEQTLVHLGRHELGGETLVPSFFDDPNLVPESPESAHANRLRMQPKSGLFQLREDPTGAGTLLATYSYQDFSAAGGVIVRLTAPPGTNPDEVVLEALTPIEGDDLTQRTGTFRNPLPMSDGSLVAAYSPSAERLTNLGSTAAPEYNYSYRLWSLAQSGESYEPVEPLTEGFEKDVEWTAVSGPVSWSGTLWELDPVEVTPRERPSPGAVGLEPQETSIFDEYGVDVDAFRAWLYEHDLALLVGRNVTQRDRADVQQPYNLRVVGGTESIATSGIVYDVAYLQVFQADQLRSYTGGASAWGRRVLARPMHAEGAGGAGWLTGGPEGSVGVEADGSFAALVPASRALSWQLVDQAGSGVVLERNWVSFAPGEIRVCKGCHGVNTASQTGSPPAENEPAALRTLLAEWVAQ